MIGSFALLLDPAVWAGSGGAAFGALAGHLSTRRGRLAKLEAEVTECRKRDGDFVVVSAAFRMMVGEMARQDEHNPVLRMTRDLLQRKLGPVPSIEDMADLLRQVDEADQADREPPAEAP